MKSVIKQIMYCDRCEKECGKNRSNRGYILRTSTEPYYALDLCQECYDSLYEWVKRGSKNEVKE